MGNIFKDELLQMFESGLRAVAPDGAVLRHLSVQGDCLEAGGERYDLSRGRVVVLGGGKGAAPMAQALENLLGDRISEGLVVVKYHHGLPLNRIKILEAGHPVPDEAGERATTAMLDMAHAAGGQDLVICLFTGGASALTPAPVEGVSLDDLRGLTQLLLGCGASIDELNAVRKHLSRFSGGHLARAASPARVLGLLVSDVVGDKPDVIASGPTVPDTATFAHCLDIVNKYGLCEKLPHAVRRWLRAGGAGEAPETPKPGDAVFSSVRTLLVASNRQALDAAAAAAEALGFEPRILTDALEGEARDQAVLLVDEARETARTLRPGDRPVCLLVGGETTVTLRGKGKGGRNQEMALAAALALEGDTRIAALFAGTDGTDGPTDAAGGFAHGNSAAAMRAAGCNPLDELTANNSYAALQSAGDLLITGPTRTNVMDMGILLVQPPCA